MFAQRVAIFTDHWTTSKLTDKMHVNKSIVMPVHFCISFFLSHHLLNSQKKNEIYTKRSKDKVRKTYFEWHIKHLFSFIFSSISISFSSFPLLDLTVLRILKTFVVTWLQWYLNLFTKDLLLLMKFLEQTLWLRIIVWSLLFDSFFDCLSGGRGVGDGDFKFYFTHRSINM